MSQLFEYGKWVPVQNKDGLKAFLRTIWQQRSREELPLEEENEIIDSKYQPFLQFDDNNVRANNYIGFIQHENEMIEIYPKVFKGLECPDKNLMLKHIFYWFSYCRKWKFPFNRANVDNHDIESFPELIIYLIANQFLDTISSHPFMQYQAVEDRVTTPRGSINFNRYLNRSMVTGNYHQVEVDHEPFLYDNKVNRIIKYCARLLLNQTRFAENQRLLQEIVFVLDEVEDTPVTLAEVNSVKLNPFFDDYTLLMDMSKNIITQQIYSHNSYDFSQWCLLFPMEYIFEDFLAGFLETHFSDQWKVEYQKSNAYLASNPDAFQMQHDIFLTSRGIEKRKIIIDTKYKLRDYSSGDPKKGVAQPDLYQVVSYAFRRGCGEVILIYPNKDEFPRESAQFEVESGFLGNDKILVKVVEIPFWSMNSMEGLKASLINSLKGLLEAAMNR